MKKLLMITTMIGFIGSNGYAASLTTVKEEKIVNAIQKGAQNDEWKQYTPSMKCSTTQSLYFKKSLKNQKYYTYRYQNRHRNTHTTVYAKVDYTKNGFHVQFVDKVGMNLGRLGIDSKIDRSLDELKKAINLELAARS